jgi:hypothetical protein
LISLCCLGFGSGGSENVDEVDERATTFSGEVVDLMEVSGRSLISWCCLGFGSRGSKDVDEVEGRATTFSEEVIDLVLLSGVWVCAERVCRRSGGEGDDVLGRGR